MESSSYYDSILEGEGEGEGKECEYSYTYKPNDLTRKYYCLKN